LFSHLFLLFSLITITHSPTSTLFPYTTLFRSHMETEHVTGTSDGGVGDPSPVTSLGIYYGMKAAAKEKFGSESLKDKKIAVQGVDRKSTRLNSSHVSISYAVFCLKKKNIQDVL